MRVRAAGLDGPFLPRRYSAASPFISLRDCAAHEFHSVGHFCAVVNRVSPTGHDFSDAKVNQHSGQSGPTRSGCPTMRDDDVVVGALAAGAVVARSPCRSAPGSSVHGQQRQSPAASSETPTSSKRTHAIRATAGSPVKEGGHGAERMPLPGDSSLGFAASTRSVDSPATNKAWSTPTTRTVVRWRKQPPSPAFMIWKLFYTHTCGTATPMQVTLSGFLKLLRTAGLLQGEEDFASNPVGDAPCISEDEAVRVFCCRQLLASVVGMFSIFFLLLRWQTVTFAHENRWLGPRFSQRNPDHGPRFSAWQSICHV